VKLAFTMRGAADRAHRLRHAAGNAVANGYPYDEALAAITRVPADMFGGTDAGRIRPGALANVVVWNGDPLELDSWPIAMFVRGDRVPLDSGPNRLAEPR
jgi:imidazolonepropionase-like amidohydrolase